MPMMEPATAVAISQRKNSWPMSMISGTLMRTRGWPAVLSASMAFSCCASGAILRPLPVSFGYAGCENCGTTIPKGAIVTVLRFRESRRSRVRERRVEFYRSQGVECASGVRLRCPLLPRCGAGEDGSDRRVNQVFPMLARAHRTTREVEYIDLFHFRGPASLPMEWLTYRLRTL